MLYLAFLQVKGLLDIVSAASEFDTLPLRPGEELVVEQMIKHAPVAVDKPRFSDPHTKVNALLQAHFSRERLHGDLGNDTRTAVRESARLLQVSLGSEHDTMHRCSASCKPTLTVAVTA
jgi:pre-mRNA-splicing helicase BRR2